LSETVAELIPLLLIMGFDLLVAFMQFGKPKR
jgi:hypothetical protein